MDLRDYITSETSALADRLIAAAEHASQHAQLQSSEQIDLVRQEVERLREELESERARATTLAAQLDAESEHASALALQLDTESLRASTLATQLDAETARHTRLASQLEAETERANALAAHVESESARAAALAADVQAEAARSSCLAADVQAETARSAALAAELQTAAARSTEMSTTLEAEMARSTDLAARLAESEALLPQLADARADLGRLRQELEDAQAITNATSAEMSASSKRAARIVSLLNASIASADALSSAQSVADLFAVLVRELGTEFDRVAIFRVKGNHLEGDIAAGLEDSTDIQKIVVPIGLESVITKAASGSGVHYATRELIGNGRPPFGGSPVAALAAPLLFDGDVVAVVYAESDAVLTDAHGPLATLLVRYAHAVLASLAQELRTSRHLREYARTLLHEARTMHDADAASGVPDRDRIERLRESIGFARDLYGQRAALEAPLSMDLLDDEIGRLLREPITLFTGALAAIVLEGAERPTAASA